MSDDDLPKGGPDNAVESLPTVDELRAAVDRPGGRLAEAGTSSIALQRLYEERFSDVSVKSQRAVANLNGIRDHYRHKKNWSWFLMGAMAAMVIFQSVLLYRVGKGDWIFTDYEWLLPALLVQNLGQFVGLAVFAVKSLFRDID